MVTDPHQRGFTLLIGLILLAGMTMLAVSLAQRGLLDTRRAYFAEQGTLDFQQQDGQVEMQLANLERVIQPHLNQICSNKPPVLTSGTQLGVQHLCLSVEQAGLSPQVRAVLERRYATSFGTMSSQQLTHYRYFNLRLVPQHFDASRDQGQGIYQGVVTLSTGDAVP